VIHSQTFPTISRVSATRKSGALSPHTGRAKMKGTRGIKDI